MFSSGGHQVKYSGGSSSGAGGASHATVDDVIRVYFDENYNSLLKDVERYTVLDRETFKSITNTTNPYDANGIEGVSLSDLTWNRLIGTSDIEAFEYGYMPINGNLFMTAFKDALTELGLPVGYSMSGNTPSNESEYNEAVSSGKLIVFDNNVPLSSSLLPLYNDIMYIYADYESLYIHMCIYILSANN